MSCICPFCDRLSCVSNDMLLYHVITSHHNLGFISNGTGEYLLALGTGDMWHIMDFSCLTDLGEYILYLDWITPLDSLMKIHLSKSKTCRFPQTCKTNSDTGELIKIMMRQTYGCVMCDHLFDCLPSIEVFSAHIKKHHHEYLPLVQSTRSVYQSN